MKLKRMQYILLAGILTAFLFNGCGKNAAEQNQESNASQELTEEGSPEDNNENKENTAAAEESSDEIEVREITEPEWEEQAVITLGETITIDGSGAEVKENIISISEGGSYEFNGTLADGMIYIETDEAVRLLLNGASITSTTGPAIYAYDSEEVWIETVKGTENVLADGEEYNKVYEESTSKDSTSSENAETSENTETSEDTEASEDTGKGTVFSNDDLIFAGNGTLTITGNYKHGICSDDSVYFQSGTCVLTAVKDGVHVNDAIVINGGDIQVEKANDGMESEGLLIVNGGRYTANAADDGLTCAGDVTINGGTVTVTACAEGVESKTNLIINGGTVEVTGTDDGLNGGTLVQINDGFVYSNISNGDGVDSNGELQINGGYVIALGGNAPEGGADCDNNSFIITGGILIATGGVNSAPTEASCTQAAVLLGAAAKGDTIGIKDAEGNTVFSFQVSKAYSNLLLSGSFLAENSSYTVYTGGTINGAETYQGYYADAEYEGGTESVTFTVDGMVVSAGGTAGMQGGMKGGMGGGMRGQMPENGEFPQNGETSENGEFPQNGDRPERGEMPEGMEPPTDGQMPEGMEPPTDGQMPEGLELPEGAQIPEDGMAPDNLQEAESDSTL